MAFLWSKLLMLLLVTFASGKPFEGEKKKIEKLMGALDNMFDQSIKKQCKTTVMDIGFLIENPPKHDKDNAFVKSLDFVKRLSKSLNVSDMGNHVGLVTYGKHPYMVFDLNEHFTVDDVFDAIEGVPKPSHGGNVNTGKALMFVKKQLFDSSARAESRKALIVLTSESSKEKVYKAAEVLKKSGVMIYAIGVDSKYPMVQLNDVASDPIEKHKFLTESSKLRDMVDPIKDLLCHDSQHAPEAPPPNRSRKTKPAASLTKSKALDEPPHARSDLEVPGRILDLGNRESDSNNDGDPDDENTKSSLDGPTSTPFEEQAKNSDNSGEVMSPGNPTMAPAEEPKEDKETKQKMITSAETVSESTNIEPAQSMATPTSTVTKVAPTKHEEFSMPTEPSSTPEPLSAEQEKLSMPTEPSSTPAPLPTPAESPVETSTSPPALTPTKSDVEMKENEKLSMPTTPSSTPAPLPTEQASPTVENPVVSPTTSTALTPTKSDAKKPEAPTPKTVSQTTPSLFSALLKKHAPTMPVKELPDMPNRNRRSNITDVKTGPFKDFDDKTNTKKSQADPFKDVDVKTDKKKSHKADPLKDFSDKTNKTNSHTDDPFGVFDDKTNKKKSHSDIDNKTKKKTSHSDDPFGVFDDKTNKKKSHSDPLKNLNDNTNKKNSHSDDPFGVFDDKTNKKKSHTADPFEEFDDKTKKKKSYSADPFEEFDDKTNKKTSHQENTIQGSKKDSTQDSMTQNKLFNQSDSNETAMQEAVFNQSDSNETAMQEDKLFDQSESEEPVEARDSSDHSGDAAVKEPVIAKPKPVKAVKPVKPVKLVKPVKPVYSRTQPASFVLRKECKARVDLTFLLDGSQGIGKMRFERSLQFVKDLVKSFRVSKDDAHVSMVVCSQKPHVVFDLSAFSDHDSIERAMGSITYPGGKMFAGGCLKTIKTGIFENSGRHGVPKILYFMSSGKSNDHVNLPSRALRDLGVQVFSLGLGTKYNARELKEVATAPYYDHVLATRYEILDLLRPYVTAQLCRGSGGKLVSRVADKVPKKKQSELKAKTVITPSKNEDGFRKSMLSELKEKEKKKKAALKADIRKKLHILLSKLGRKFHDEKAIYRSIIYNINGHRDAGCKDYHILCKTWGKKGYCKKSSAKHGIDAYSVQRVCPKTCVVCYQ